MTLTYSVVDLEAQEEESLRTIAAALNLGINLLDTAWIYQVFAIMFIFAISTTSCTVCSTDPVG